MEIEIGKYYKRNDWCYSHVLDIVRKVDEELVIVKVNEVLCNRVDEYDNHYYGLYNKINVLFNINDGFVEVTKEEFLSVYDEVVKKACDRISSKDGYVSDSDIHKCLYKCYKDDNNSYRFVEDYFPKGETDRNTTQFSLCCVEDKDDKKCVTWETFNLDKDKESYFDDKCFGNEVTKKEYLKAFNRVAKAQREIF
jgi:hypothetical protein